MEDLFEKVNGLEIMEQYGVKLVKKGKEYVGLCPFHQEKNPSFYYNDELKVFHCFGCPGGGSIVSFVKEMEEISYWQAKSKLAERYGIKLEELSPHEKEEYARKQQLLEILTSAAHYFHNLLICDPRGKKYKEHLNSYCGFTDETLRAFIVGVALDSSLLCKYLLEKGYERTAIIESGVIKQLNNGDLKDYYDHRIIFPFIGIDGIIKNLTGRATEETPEEEKSAKYRHLPGKLSLYNESSLKQETVIIVEGPTDCLSLYQNGYNAVALVGLNLPEESDLKFAKTKELFICLDGDERGKEATLRIAERFIDKAKIAQMPDGVDPNDYFRTNSKKDFDSLLASAKDVITLGLESIPTNIEKKKLKRKLEPLLAKMAKLDEPDIESYLSEAKARFDLIGNDVDAYRTVIKRIKKEINQQKTDIKGTKRKPEYRAVFDGLVDLVLHEGNSAFLIKEDEKLLIRTEVEINGATYTPPRIDKIPWMLPRGNDVLEQYHRLKNIPEDKRNKDIYEELIAYHKNISELPCEEHYDLLTAWDLHTYLLEAFQCSPTICLYAVPERGKSRTGKGLIYVAYRGLHVESLRDAYIVRVADRFNASIFFDVMNIWKKAEKMGTEDILLNRFERGAKVPRVLYPEKAPFEDTVYFSIFGATIISTNEEIHKILDTRAVIMNMPESTKKFNNEVKPELSLPLKEKLVAFRALNLGRKFEDIPKLVSGRLGDILRPLHQIIRFVNPEREEVFLKLAENINQSKLTLKAESLEAQILCVIRTLENKVKNGRLSVADITEKFNESKDEKSKINSRTIGRRLNSLGFDKVRTGTGSSAIYWNRTKLDTILESYGLNKTSVTSEISETNEKEIGVSGVSEVSEDNNGWIGTNK